MNPFALILRLGQLDSSGSDDFAARKELSVYLTLGYQDAVPFKGGTLPRSNCADAYGDWVRKPAQLLCDWHHR